MLSSLRPGISETVSPKSTILTEGKAITIKPQKGFQEHFLQCPADILIGGSGAGVGKTFASLMEASRHSLNPKFGAVFFRRTFSQIELTGGLLDASKELYYFLGAKLAGMKWTFPKGATVAFCHLQHEDDIYNHQGGEYPLIIFDELTHFTEKQFWYMLSRNRSTCGIKPYIRATCNPDPDSWVARLIEWWIGEDGFPIIDRIDKMRYFIKDGENIAWGDNKGEVLAQVPHMLKDIDQSVNPLDLVKSIMFIPGSIYENKELLRVNPQYLANLMSQSESERSRLLLGNWKISSDAMCLFDYDKITDAFTNFLPQSGSIKKYITCDAARLGRDFCVIMVWQGWEVIAIEVIRKSEVGEIIEAIENKRAKFGVPKSQCLIDQDGVGAATVKQGGYKGFSGGAAPFEVKGEKEYYKNLKTQMYFFMALSKINAGVIRINVNEENCIVDGQRGASMKVKGKVVSIVELIRQDLRAIKRVKPDKDVKFQINDKEAQKLILGRSPDFGDTLMMRGFFDFAPKLHWY